jgi:predicted sugar kinase
MALEINTPACLPLGLVRAGSATYALGLALQHPPINISALAAVTLEVSGACFPLGRAAAEKMLVHEFNTPAELEIELAIPLLMGLGGEPLLALSVAKAITTLNQTEVDAVTLHHWLSLDALAALDNAAFTEGGLVQVNLSPSMPSGVQRHVPIQHEEQEAWAVVLYLPRPNAHHADELEAERRAALLNAAPHLSPATGALVENQLWPAVQQDDFAAFSRALAELHAHNATALQAAGTPLTSTPQAQTALDIFQAEGVVAYGQCLTGLGVFAFVKGATASQELRKNLMARLGYEAGTIMAAITDNAGCVARHMNRHLPPDFQLN